MLRTFGLVTLSARISEDFEVVAALEALVTKEVDRVKVLLDELQRVSLYVHWVLHDRVRQEVLQSHCIFGEGFCD